MENCLWANTVVASGKAIGLVIYTGSETRAVMNTSSPQTKVGLVDLEINTLAKVKKKKKSKIYKKILKFFSKNYEKL